MLRLGGPIFGKVTNAVEWIAELQKWGYHAAYCPLGNKADDATVREYQAAAARADIVIAEVGAWSNPISADNAIRQAAMTRCEEQLALADRVGALCCVNIAGSRGEQWDGPHPDNFSEETFDLIVETVRAIIDSVKPTRTYYTLETMPWVFPDSPDNYLRLIHAIDRRRFAAHLDPANMINSPRRFYDNSNFIKDCFAKLGPYIKSCHAKDITLSGKMTVHLAEVRPGLGALDYPAFLREIHRCNPELPVMLEHLPNAEEYAQAAAYVRSAAQRAGF
jgi:sugar phosphate isomerase/epimerase